MWIMLNDAFFSIVQKDGTDRHSVLVRARRAGDIEKYFPNAKVTKTPKADYLFRATVRKAQVRSAMDQAINDITYDNFKNSVRDNDLHDAYLGVWLRMESIQPNRKRKTIKLTPVTGTLRSGARITGLR